MKRSKKDLINYRIHRAWESLEEAQILTQTGHWNTVANRLYYSAFYRVNALFSLHDLTATSHSGVKSEFHKLFIKQEVFDKSLGKLYSELFDKRQEGDYQDFYSFEKNDIEPLIKLTEEFLKTVEEQIKSA